MPNEVWCVIEFRCHFHLFWPYAPPTLQLISADQEIWCQRRDSNSQTPVSKTGCYSNSHTLALWCTGEDLNLRVPLPKGKPGYSPVPFPAEAHAPVQLGGKSRRIERPSLITMPRFSGPVAGHSAVPSALAESAGVEPVSLLREPLFSRQVPYRPAHSPLNCQRTKGFW